MKTTDSIAKWSEGSTAL